MVLLVLKPFTHMPLQSSLQKYRNCTRQTELCKHKVWAQHIHTKSILLPIHSTKAPSRNGAMHLGSIQSIPFPIIWGFVKELWCQRYIKTGYNHENPSVEIHNNSSSVSRCTKGMDKKLTKLGFDFQV